MLNFPQSVDMDNNQLWPLRMSQLKQEPRLMRENGYLAGVAAKTPPGVEAVGRWSAS